MPSFERNLLTQRHEICSQETRDFTLSYGKNTESISPALESVRDRQTDGRTDRITIANIRAKHSRAKSNQPTDRLTPSEDPPVNKQQQQVVAR